MLNLDEAPAAKVSAARLSRDQLFEQIQRAFQTKVPTFHRAPLKTAKQTQALTLCVEKWFEQATSAGMNCFPELLRLSKTSGPTRARLQYDAQEGWGARSLLMTSALARM